VSSERRSIQTVEEQEEIVGMVQRSPTTSTRRIASRLRVPQSRMWRTLHYDGLYPFHHQPVQHLHPGDDAHRPEFCHWLSHNRELLPYILFTDEATFTRNSITNTRNCHNWVQDNPHAAVSVNVCCPRLGVHKHKKSLEFSSKLHELKLQYLGIHLKMFTVPLWNNLG